MFLVTVYKALALYPTIKELEEANGLSLAELAGDCNSRVAPVASCDDPVGSV
jgi:hypothetical protein